MMALCCLLMHTHSPSGHSFYLSSVLGALVLLMHVLYLTQSDGGRWGVNCGVETPPALPLAMCSGSEWPQGLNWPCGPVAGGGFTGQMRVGAGVGGLHCDLGAVSTWGGSWSVPPSLGARCVESDTGVHLPLIAFGSHRVLSDVPECLATLLGLFTGLFCFWPERPSLILQGESWLHSTDTLAWMEKSNRGESKALMVFDFSLTCSVQSLFTSRYGNQGHPSLTASVVTVPKSVRAQLRSEQWLVCGRKKQIGNERLLLPTSLVLVVRHQISDI